MRKVWVTKIEKDEPTKCDCCGTRLIKRHYLSNGDVVGVDCALIIERPTNWRVWGISKKVENYLRKNGLIE